MASPQPGGDAEPNDDDSLVGLLRGFMTPTTVIVCVGNELRGDDGAGPAVARGLSEPAPGDPTGKLPWPVLDAATAPENYLVKVAQRRPASVLLVDALNLAAPPGTIQLLDGRNVAGEGPSTHGPAPAGFIEALGLMHPCPCAVLGIQPRSVQFGSPLSPPVDRAVRRVVQALRRLAGGR